MPSVFSGEARANPGWAFAVHFIVVGVQGGDLGSSSVAADPDRWPPSQLNVDSRYGRRARSSARTERRPSKPVAVGSNPTGPVTRVGLYMIMLILGRG